MLKYTFMFVWLLIVMQIQNKYAVRELKVVNGERKVVYGFKYSLLVFFPILFMVAFREKVFDTGGYIAAFSNMPSSWDGLVAYMESISKDIGFYFLSSVVKIIFGNSYHIYFLIIALIQGICLICIYRKYSYNYLITIFLFLASTDYISWMYNGIRQFTAVSIVFLATPLFIEKQYVKAIMVIIIASLFHQSALLMIPFVFVSMGKAYNKKTLISIVFVLIVLFAVDSFTNVLDSLLMSTQYKNVVTDWKATEDDGTNIIRVLVYSIPALLAFFKMRLIRKIDSSIINFTVNMSIVSMGLYVISHFTSGIFIGRLPIYCSLYNYILLPWEVENLFTKHSRFMVYLLMIFCYLIFYYYQMHLVWELW